MSADRLPEKEAARRSLALADSVAYYADRRYRELRTEHAAAGFGGRDDEQAGTDGGTSDHP